MSVSVYVYVSVSVSVSGHVCVFVCVCVGVCVCVCVYVVILCLRLSNLSGGLSGLASCLQQIIHFIWPKNLKHIRHNLGSGQSHSWEMYWSVRRREEVCTGGVGCTGGGRDRRGGGVRGGEVSPKPESAVGAYCTQLRWMRVSGEEASPLHYRSQLSVYLKWTVNLVYESGTDERREKKEETTSTSWYTCAIMGKSFCIHRWRWRRQVADWSGVRHSKCP